MSLLPPPPPSVDSAQVVEARRYGVERQINPFVAVLEEVRRCAGHVAWLGIKVSEAPDDGALLESHSQWLRLYREERAALVKVSETAVRLGLEERVVRIEEGKAELMVRALIATMDALGLPQETRDRVPAELRRQLLAIETPST